MSSSKIDRLMTNYISKLKWAWQAQFLSHILVILKTSVFFEDKQMILVSFFDIFAGFRFPKNLKSLPIQFLSHPWLSMAQNWYWTLHIRRSIHRLSHAEQRQRVILGPLELTYLFGPSNKVVYLKKLVFQSVIRFLILFALTDTILLKLDLQKRTSVLDNPLNGKLFV